MWSWNIIGLVGLLLFTGSLVLFIVLVLPQSEPPKLLDAPGMPTRDDRPTPKEPALTVTNQDAGVRFFIGAVRTDRASWVVVYTDDAPEPLGAFFFPQYDGIQSGGGVLWRSLQSGGHYRAALHEDDGDMSFHAENDPPLMDEAGRPVQAEFSVR